MAEENQNPAIPPSSLPLANNTPDVDSNNEKSNQNENNSSPSPR